MVDVPSLSFVFGLAVALGYFLAVALGYFLAVGVGIPLSLLALVVERRVKPVARAIGYVAVLPALGLVVLVVSVGRLDDPLSGVPGTLAIALVLALAWDIPLLVGRALLVRLTDLGPERALYHALLGLPVSLLANVVVSVAPGGFARRNICSSTVPPPSWRGWSSSPSSCSSPRWSGWPSLGTGAVERR